MLFAKLAFYLSQLEKTPLRNQMTQILAEVFGQCQPEEIDKVCYLVLGRLAPSYKGIEFNMGEKLMVKAIARAYQVNEKETSKIYKTVGDLGKTVEKLGSLTAKKSKKSSLSVVDVYNSLFNIASQEGEGSVERKINKMASLLRKLDVLSAKYLVRIPINKLRLGFSDMTILDALSWLAKKDKSLRPELEKAFNVMADIGQIAKIFKAKGLKGIKLVKSRIGVPIRAAKAERLSSPEEILAKMAGKCALEPKMDGFRVQIHLDKTRKLNPKKNASLNLFNEDSQFFVRIFSRNLENITYMFPDVVEAVQKLKVKKAILDGEAIAFDPKTGKFLSFQETVQRKRKHGVLKKTKEMPLKVFVFDLLSLNGQPLLTEPFYQRRQELEKILTNKGNIVLTEQKIVSQAQEFEKFFKTMVKEGLEGLMAKKLDAVYQAGARNFNWVKFKVAMRSELADTIDCVVMGYYQGKGKRTSFGLGAFLVGIVDPQAEKFLTVSKIGTGLTDKQWQEMFQNLKSRQTSQKPKEYQVDKNLVPDVWVNPELVVEIEADTITKSPIHTAGLALRFPRLKKIRNDKTAWQATSLKELKEMVR